MNRFRKIAGLLCLLPLAAAGQSYQSVTDPALQPLLPRLTEWYQWLHAHPELSREEYNTAAYLKKEVQAAGYHIVEPLGFQSFAAVLENGSGPVILYRTDLDGLPVQEATGLPYASARRGMRDGQERPVMHACGHDLHMSTWLGTASLMARIRNAWKGTLIFLAQSAEETGQGARKILESPAWKSLPRPAMQLAIHAHAGLPAGQAGFCDGYSMAAVDMMNITLYGKGGHGAAPQQTIDPVLLAAQYVTAIQTIVSRNLSSSDRAVITVGAIHGGTAGNVIPDQVDLKLTIRSFSDSTRQYILERLKTIGNHLAAAAGLPEEKWPRYELLDMSIKAVYNQPELGAALRQVLERERGAGSYTFVPPVMIGEDFGEYGQTTDRIPSYLIWMGTVAPEKAGMAELPSLHTARFAPDDRHTLPKAVKTISACLLYGFSRKPAN